ncbi:FecR family protein [Chondrinema litorale]|uniref:FecR family protein n=1 Tax=Chondrinema litorale TaxID=2994555 RepID=UPI0025428247|nr:FecR family protein [Chondrinema litorale]UZR98799.1 FecR domain-containing protein [Chondrinema litorale]
MKNKQPKYKDFTTEDFLEDEFFVKWVKTATEETNQFWEEWTKVHPHKVPALMEAKNIILSTHYKKQDELDSTEILEMYEQIVKGNSTQPSQLGVNTNNWWSGFAKIAAVILVLLVAGFGAYQFNEQGIHALSDETEEVWLSAISPAGKKTTIRLMDGTVVKLNAGSSLFYPKQFGAKYRKVILKGEAFFDVAKNPERPFIIETGEIETKVLGTSFNIKSDSAYNKVQVAVVTGIVEVSDKGGNHIKLTPMEAVTYDSKIKNIEKHTVEDIDAVVGWKEGLLQFNKASFKEICERLETWYGVDIELAEDFKEPGAYSGRYANQSLQNVLEGISYTSEFNYKIKDKKVFISN